MEYKLDYSLKTSEERIQRVQEVLDHTPSEKLTSQYLKYMSDYILFVAEKNQTQKEKKSDYPITTKNREVTVNKRQVSFEEVVSNLENGEDGIYALISNDKNQLLDPKEKITEEDETFPLIQEQLKLIDRLKKQFDKATGQCRYLLKKQIIETWQQIYILKSSYRDIPAKNKAGSNQIKTFVNIPLEDKIYFDEKGMPRSKGVISLLNPAHISFLLCYYSELKQECYDKLNSDMFYLLLDLEALVDKTLLHDYPQLYDLLIWKVDGRSNEEIQMLMDKEYGVLHNEQYFSTLWRKRIPKLLAEQAQKDYLNWYYTNEKYGTWKQCRTCGQWKLAHPMFFAKNSSKDGWYSVCKDCRSEKTKKK